jgi:hypothetical protein
VIQKDFNFYFKKKGNIMKKLITLITIITTTSLLQSCGGSYLLGSSISNSIRTSWDIDDFGKIDNKLQGKNNIYISYDMQGLDKIKKYKIADAQSLGTCANIKDETNNKYNCFAVLNEHNQNKEGNKLFSNITSNALHINITKPVDDGNYAGIKWNVKVYDTTNNQLLDSFDSNSIYMKEIREYVAEYIALLDKNVK